MKSFANIISELSEWENLGEKILDDEARLIGHVPHIGADAWLHTIYSPLSTLDIKSLESELRLYIPLEYKEFLGNSNGLKIFSDTLSLDGQRSRNDRSNKNVRMPYNIVTPNVAERLSDAPEEAFFFGGYSWDGSLVYYEQADGPIHRCSRETAKPINTWQNLKAMLESEIKRIAMLFGPDGREKDPTRPSTPLTS